MRGKFKFLVNTPFKSIAFFRPGSSKATLLGLNNLFLAFLFIRSIYLIFYLFINEAAAFQPFYSIIFFMEDPQPNYIAFSLYFAVLFHNFIFLFNSPSIYGLIFLYKLIFKVIWFLNSIFCCFCYTLTHFLFLINIFMLYFLFWVPFILFRGFIFINLFIRPLVYVLVNTFNLINNWVESMEREDLIKIKESFGILTPIIL